jgi:hypothetical protein
MSYFAFNRDTEGNIVINDEDLLCAIEKLINNLELLNVRFEEAFDTKISEDDL